MSLIENIDPDVLQNNVIRKNLTIDALRNSLKELKKNKKELDGMTVDGCHMEALPFLKARYWFIIKNIEEMIDFMNKGDWCLSVQNTKKREEEMVRWKKK